MISFLQKKYNIIFKHVFVIYVKANSCGKVTEYYRRFSGLESWA